MEKIGVIIRNKVKERGLTHVEFARLINTHIRNVHNIYNRSSIDTDLLLHISEVLKFDFFSVLGGQLVSNVDRKEFTDNSKAVYTTSIYVKDLLSKIKKLEEENSILKESLKDKNTIIRLLKNKNK